MRYSEAITLLNPPHAFTVYILDNYAPVNAQAYITAITNTDVSFLIFLLYFFCYHYRIISFQVAVRLS